MTLQLKASDFDLVVFDMAGTTVRDQGEVPAAFRGALEEFGVPITAERIAKLRGASKRDGLRALLGPGREKLLEAVYARFTELLREDYQRRAAAIEGAELVFARIRALGIAIALGTGFDRAIVTLLLEAVGWAPADFAGVICGDEVAHGRPAPDIIQAAMRAAGATTTRRVIAVGDTVLDLLAGDAAGVGANIGVLSGAHTREQLVTAPHTHLIASVRDLPGLLS